MKMSRIAFYCLSFAVVSLLATDVIAQPGGGPGGRRGRGFGGRGGGRSVTQTAQGLLRIEDVQQELELSPEQSQALQKLLPQGRSGRGERGQREGQSAELQEQLEEVLLPEQMDRLRGIAVQVLGAGAINDPEIAEELQITELQKKELEQVRNDVRETMMAKMQELRGSGDREAMFAAMRDLRAQSNEKMEAVLTDKQKSAFAELKGKNFDMPEGAFGGGRGGFRQSGRRAGRRGAEQE